MLLSEFSLWLTFATACTVRDATFSGRRSTVGPSTALAVASPFAPPCRTRCNYLPCRDYAYTAAIYFSNPSRDAEVIRYCRPALQQAIFARTPPANTTSCQCWHSLQAHWVPVVPRPMLTTCWPDSRKTRPTLASTSSIWTVCTPSSILQKFYLTSSQESLNEAVLSLLQPDGENLEAQS